MSEDNVEKGSLGKLNETFFGKTWPVWVGGILLGLLNICLFLFKAPWGASGAYMNWGQNAYQWLGIFDTPNLMSPDKHFYSILALMTLMGAFAAALMSKEFGLRIPSIGELIKGLFGGVLMAIGATVGIGCTIGGFFSGWAALSGGALVFAIGLVVGTYIALRYLIWEMDKFPKISSGKTHSFLMGTTKRHGKWQPFAGVIVIILAFVISASYNMPLMSWFVIIGLFIGMICQRSRFCVVASIRDPFMTGESKLPIGVMAGILVSLFGFTIIKQMGIGVANPEAARLLEMTAVYSNFWLRALIGGFIFGLGMTVAGGCAVGTLWRMGEGQVKLWFSFLGFALFAPISKMFIVPFVKNMLPHSTRHKLFLPDLIGYAGAVVVFLIIILLWYMFVKWNERTEKFTVL